MHPSAMECGRAFFSAYAGDAPKVLDIGSRNVNGSLKDVAPPDTEYLGVDIEAGPGVDRVVVAGDALPFAADQFDLVVSTSCFEHDPCFWETILEAMRVVKPGGYFYFNAPSNGAYHGYPFDNWRFYPDSGLALTAWLKKKAVPASLIESGTLEQRGAIWNDFYAVFQKSNEGGRPSSGRMIHEGFPRASNVRIGGATDVINFQRQPEDIRHLYRQDLLSRGLRKARRIMTGRAR